MPHYLTNRGKLLLLQGDWDDVGASVIYCGLLAGASIPAAIDTEAEIQDFNFVSELLAATGVDEPVGGWYARQNLSRTNAAEDDTNNRVNLDAANVTFTAATAGENLYGAFWAKEIGTDAQDELMGVILFSSVIPTNGSDIQLTITDLVRAS